MLPGIRAVLFQPGIETESCYVQSFGDLGHAVTEVGYLTNRFNLEFFGVAFAAQKHRSSC